MILTKDDLQRIKVNMQGNLTLTTLFRLIGTIDQAWATIACHEQGIFNLSRTVEGLVEERDDAIKEGLRLTILLEDAERERQALTYRFQTCDIARARLEHELAARKPDKTYIGVEEERNALKAKVRELEGEQRRLAVARSSATISTSPRRICKRWWDG